MNKNNRLIGSTLLALIACSLIFLVSSCASQEAVSDQPKSSPTESSPPSSSDNAGAEQQNLMVSNDSAESKSVPDNKTAHEQISQTQKESGSTQPPVPAIEITAECKQQPFVKYKTQAEQSIKKGWEAKKAERFGVGFRNEAEYKKWSDTSNQLFTKVSELCSAMSACAKQNKADKEKKCAAEAERFGQWQDLAEKFVAKAKTVETTQPPMLCSLEPSADDLSQCFNLLADKIEDTCVSAQCKETSICFRGVYFLDDAINQAKLACSYVGQKLSECRGYVEETGRRSAAFERCLDKFKQLPVEISPVI